MHSIAPHDLMVAVLAGDRPEAGVVDRAFAASTAFWQRVLAIESCAVRFDRALRAAGLADMAPPPLRQMLRDATARAVRHALMLPGQMAELADASRELGIRIMVLKGAARHLDAGICGTRSMSDIDVLASPADAVRLHQSLRRRRGYEAMSACPEHHLPALRRVGALPVEVHIQLGPHRTDLDARIWLDARTVVGTDLVVPSATSSLLHSVEHGALVHWAVRYRLRDLLDVAEAWGGEVDREQVNDYLSRHPHRGALTTMLGGARRFAAGISLGRPSAWRTVRRVARARHLFAACVPDEAYAKSLCIAGGVLAEASPRALLRPAQLALFGVKQARVAPRAS